jgi:LuxR family transcriptional regulator, maltose regulon positive regulatory protein
MKQSAQAPLLAYVGRLLEAQGSRPLPIGQSPSSSVTPQATGNNLIEPLTDREHEVLRLLAAGLSNREIAEQLVVSVNTVKAHAKSVNSKLNTHNRTQAVNRAQELGLL